MCSDLAPTVGLPWKHDSLPRKTRRTVRERALARFCFLPPVQDFTFFGWQGWIFSAPLLDDKTADREGISFPEPAELAESSPRPFAHMQEMPAQHSPFQRSPLLPPACCNRTGSINRSPPAILNVLWCAGSGLPRRRWARPCPAPCPHAHP